MACLPSLPAGAVLLDMYRGYPQTARPLRDYYQALLRRTSPLAVAERELITADVPGLNAPGYGYGVHQVIAQTFGVDQETLGVLLADVTTAPAGERIKLGPLPRRRERSLVFLAVRGPSGR